MKPPILQTAWHNRVFRPNGGRGGWHETFSVACLAPDGQRALWIDFTLARRGADELAEVSVVWVGGPDVAARRLQQRFPSDRVGQDPERAGVGVADCILAEGASHGRVADGDGALCWRLTLPTDQAPYCPLPAPSGLVGRWLRPQWCAPVLFGVAAGEVELWHGHGNHTPVTRTSLDGWQVVQTHRWGGGRSPSYAMLVASGAASRPDVGVPGPAPGPPRLVAVALPWGVGPWGHRLRAVGRLWRGDGSQLGFDGWRSLVGGSSQAHAAAWAATVPGHGGELRWRVDLPPSVGEGGEVPFSSDRRWVTHAAGVQVDLRAAGQSWEDGGERLQLGQALCEVVAPATAGADASA